MPDVEPKLVVTNVSYLPGMEGSAHEISEALKEELKRIAGYLKLDDVKILETEPWSKKHGRPSLAPGGRRYRLVFIKGNVETKWPAFPLSLMTMSELAATIRNLDNLFVKVSKAV